MSFLRFAEGLEFTPLTFDFALSLEGNPPTDATVGVPYNYLPTVRGGVGPFVFDLVSGSLPAGLSLNPSTGRVSGTPTTEQTASNIVIRVTDNASDTATLAAFSIDVGAAPLPEPQFTSQPSISSGFVGDTFTLDEGAVDQPATFELVYFRLDGSSRMPELVGNTWDSTGESPGEVTFRFRASNGNGEVLSDPITFDLTAGPTLAPTTLTNTFTYLGEVYITDIPVLVCYDCTGEPALISDRNFNITQLGTASGLVSGAKGDFIANGAMIDPGDLSVTGQGFDGLLGQDDGGGQSASETAYVSELNVDPAINGPIPVLIGEEKTIVKAYRRSGVTETSGDWRTIEEVTGYHYISILDSVPPAGFIRPGIAPGPMTIWGTEGDLDYGVLRSLPFMPGLSADAAAAANDITPAILYCGISNGEVFRRFGTEGASNYSRDLSLTRSRAAGWLQTDQPQADKRLPFLRCIKHGIDLAVAHRNGYTGFGGAGQNYGRAFFSYVAAFALQSPELLSAAQAMGGGALRQHFWAVQSELEQPVNFPTGNGDDYLNNAALLQSDLNIPEFDRDVGDPSRRDASPDSRYRQFWTAGMLEALNVALLQNGPGGISGVDAILQGGAFDHTNEFAAALAFYFRQRNVPQSLVTAYDFNADRQALWDAWSPLMGLTPWTGRPEWVVEEGRVTGGDGEISYDWSEHIWATEPITRRDVRYSLDGRRWTIMQDVAGAGTITGLMHGATYYVGFRLVSASGPGRWSVNYETRTRPSNEGGGTGPRNTATTTGSAPVATPANVVAPQIMVREVESWPGSDLIDAGATYTTAQRDANVVLYAGVGDWTGFPAPTFTYQWQLGGVDLPGDTESFLDPRQRFDLSEGVLTAAITADNGIDPPVTVVSAPITLPEILPPANYLADFAAGDASAGFVGGAAEGEAPATLAYDAANGELDVNLGGDFPYMTTGYFDVVRGDDYEIPINFRNDSGGSMNFHALDADGNPINGRDDVNGTALQTHSFTVTAPDYRMAVQAVRRGNATGDSFSIISIGANRVIPTPTDYLDEDFGSGDFSAAYATLNAQSVSYNAGAGQLDVVLTGSNQGFRRNGPPTLLLPQSVIDNAEQVEVVLDLVIPSLREFTVRLGRPGDDKAYGDFNRFLSAGTVQTTQIVTPTQTEFRVALFGRSGPAETFGLQRLRVRPVA